MTKEKYEAELQKELGLTYEQFRELTKKESRYNSY